MEVRVQCYCKQTSKKSKRVYSYDAWLNWTNCLVGVVKVHYAFCQNLIGANNTFPKCLIIKYHGQFRTSQNNSFCPCVKHIGQYGNIPVSYTHLRAHETRHDLVCRLLLEKKKNN